MKKTFLTVIFFIFLLPVILYPGGDVFNDWVNFSKSPSRKKLVQWMYCKLRENIEKKKCNMKLEIAAPRFFGRLGVFVTLKKGKKVRGCFGAFSHSSDRLEHILSVYLKGAVMNDPRYEPVDASEISGIKIIITIADVLHPVNNIDFIDISRYGVLITDESNNQRVYVPSEIRSIEYLKSKLGSKKIIQISAFRALAIE